VGLHVYDIEWNVEVVGDAASVSHLIRRATAVSRDTAHGSGFTPQAHHHANDIVARFHQQGSGY
jgi:hypothetical protein